MTLIKDDFDQAKENKRALLISNYFKSNFNWDDGIDILNKASLNKDNYEVMSSFENIGFKTLGSLATRTVGYYQSILPMPSEYDDINTVINNIYSDLGHTKDLPLNQQVFANITGTNYSSSKHQDNWGVIYIQVIGKTGWKIYEDVESDSIVQEFTMNPGDIALFDRGIIHQVSANTPRLSISCAIPNGLTGLYTDYVEQK